MVDFEFVKKEAYSVLTTIRFGDKPMVVKGIVNDVGKRTVNMTDIQGRDVDINFEFIVTYSKCPKGN